MSSYSAEEIRDLIAGMRDEEVAQRRKSARASVAIAQVLGPQRTREELLPYITETVSDVEEDEEVLLDFAEVLGSQAMLDAAGGVAECTSLLLPLESLASTDDGVVREKAVGAVSFVLGKMPPALLQADGVSLVRQLASAEFASPKTSAAPALGLCYSKLPTSDSSRKELRELFVNLCQDDSPLVRKAACGVFGQVCKASTQLEVQTELLPQFARLAQDPQDAVRIAAVPNIGDLAAHLSKEKVKAQVIPVLRQLCADKSWRVRYMVADQFDLLSDNVGAEEAKSTLVPALVTLLRDNEAEVRTAAAFKTASACRRAGVDVSKSQVLPAVKELAADTNQHVRAALATVVLEISPIIGKEVVMTDLLPLCLSMLQDEFHEVRMNVICKLEALQSVIGLESLQQSLIPAVSDLAQDKSWRVRLSILERTPLLARQLGEGFFQDRMIQLCTEWLGDSVFAVREAAVNNLVELVTVFGGAWGAESVLPAILDLLNHQNYLLRVIALQAFESLVPKLTPDAVVAALPSIVAASRNSVANCRIRATHALQAAASIQNNVDGAKARLSEMKSDADADVAYFASQALTRL